MINEPKSKKKLGIKKVTLRDLDATSMVNMVGGSYPATAGCTAGVSCYGGCGGTWGSCTNQGASMCPCTDGCGN